MILDEWHSERTGHMKESEIKDSVIWFRDIRSAGLRARLEALRAEDEVTLVVDDVIGTWRRMKDGSDGRPTFGIKPVGPMKSVWMDWFQNRRGQAVSLRLARDADEYLRAASSLFPEWSSEADEAAFSDL